MQKLNLEAIESPTISGFNVNETYEISIAISKKSYDNIQKDLLGLIQPIRVSCKLFDKRTLNFEGRIADVKARMKGLQMQFVIRFVEIDDYVYAPETNEEKSSPEPNQAFPHYYKDVRHLDFIDVYRVLELFDVRDPAIQHAVKKLLVAGQRGVKDLLKDYKEAKASIERAEVMKDEDVKKSTLYTQFVGRVDRTLSNGLNFPEDNS